MKLIESENVEQQKRKKKKIEDKGGEEGKLRREVERGGKMRILRPSLIRRWRKGLKIKKNSINRSNGRKKSIFSFLFFLFAIYRKSTTSLDSDLKS